MRPPRAIREALALEQAVPYPDFESKVKRARCPRCKTKGRLLTGPFYRRGDLTCCECGHRMKVKVKL